MTYVVGWKSKGRVLVVADSVVTLKGGMGQQAQPRYSSIGEELISIRDHEQLADGLRKLETIENRVILGYAGRVKPALEFIMHFRRSLMRGVPTSADLIVQQFVTSLKESVDPREHATFDIVMGFVVGDVPRLYRYEKGRLDEFNDITHIGSLANNARGEIALDLLRRLQNVPEQHQLVLYSSVLQAFGGNYDVNVMQKYGVGGLFLGVQVDKKGVSWQDDTMFVGYDFEKIRDARGEAVIQGAMAITIKYFRATVMVLHKGDGSVHLVMPDLVLASFNKEREARILETSPTWFPYIAFYPSRHRRVTFLIGNPSVKNSRYFKFTRIKATPFEWDGTITLDFRNELVDMKEHDTNPNLLSLNVLFDREEEEAGKQD